MASVNFSGTASERSEIQLVIHRINSSLLHDNVLIVGGCWMGDFSCGNLGVGLVLRENGINDLHLVGFVVSVLFI